MPHPLTPTGTSLLRLSPPTGLGPPFFFLFLNMSSGQIFWGHVCLVRPRAKKIAFFLNPKGLEPSRLCPLSPKRLFTGEGQKHSQVRERSVERTILSCGPRILTCDLGHEVWQHLLSRHPLPHWRNLECASQTHGVVFTKELEASVGPAQPNTKLDSSHTQKS